jgi:hypothetical protein
LKNFDYHALGIKSKDERKKTLRLANLSTVARDLVVKDVVLILKSER